MTAIWFVGFSLVWTGLLAAGAHLLCRGIVPPRFAHNVWRGAAGMAFLPWFIAAAYTFVPQMTETTIPDLPYLSTATDVLSNTPVVQSAASNAVDGNLGTLFWTLVLGGWAIRMGLIALSQVRLQRLKRQAEPADHLSTTRWSKALGLSRAPEVHLIDCGSPFLAGIRKPVVFLPKALDRTREADIVFAHECTHMARGDLIARPFERLVADVFWFSPFAWMMRRQLDYWREAACDERASALIGDTVAYARALTHTARAIRPTPAGLPVAAFILPRRSTLKLRLNQLLQSSEYKPRRLAALAAVVTGLIIAPLSLAQVEFQNATYTHAIVVHPNARLTSAYGERKDPISKTGKFHYGVDIGAEYYTPIYAPGPGKVITAKFKDGYGKTVDIKFEDGTKMRFSQLAEYYVSVGDEVCAGDKIGKMGKSGRATGPHLHLEVWKDGDSVDPASVKGLTLF
ncbi:MAG: M23/M56 family metallopeptidase [Henriciella sp.]|nr:M23/M56 family metallopeptidase [Henriciella sp.]